MYPHIRTQINSMRAARKAVRGVAITGQLAPADASREASLQAALQQLGQQAAQLRSTGLPASIAIAAQLDVQAATLTATLQRIQQVQQLRQQAVAMRSTGLPFNIALAAQMDAQADRAINPTVPSNPVPSNPFPAPSSTPTPPSQYPYAFTPMYPGANPGSLVQREDAVRIPVSAASAIEMNGSIVDMKTILAAISTGVLAGAWAGVIPGFLSFGGLGGDVGTAIPDVKSQPLFTAYSFLDMAVHSVANGVIRGGLVAVIDPKGNYYRIDSDPKYIYWANALASNVQHVWRNGTLLA